MVGLNSCPCCGHKRRRSVLDQVKSCPVSFKADAILPPTKVARSSSLPSHFGVAAARDDSCPSAVDALPSPRIPPPTLPFPVLRPAKAFPINLEVTPAPDKKGKEGEEEKVEIDSETNGGRKLKIWGGESVKITIKCKCGSVQEVEF